MSGWVRPTNSLHFLTAEAKQKPQWSWMPWYCLPCDAGYDGRVRQRLVFVNQQYTNYLCQHEILLCKFCQSCKRRRKQNIVEGRGTAEPVLCLTELVHRSANIKASCSHFGGPSVFKRIFFFLVSPCLQVTYNTGMYNIYPCFG